jgi:Methyltransferase domain
MKSLLKTLLYKAGYSVKKIRKAPATARADHKAVGTDSADIMGLLHQTSPYAGFDFAAFSFEAHGWGGQSPAFRELIASVKPSLILEVGTWKGASSLEMAAAVRDLGLDTKIVCIDTWLGALEFWTDQSDPERYQSLRLRHGYPSVYYQFLANVCHKEFQDRIIPFPQTSSAAALWFRRFGITADMIYVDASHEEEDVYQDLCSYWEIVSDRGLMFGDDYSWDGVRLAVQRFAREEKRKIDFLADKWILRRRESSQ